MFLNTSQPCSTYRGSGHLNRVSLRSDDLFELSNVFTIKRAPFVQLASTRLRLPSCDMVLTDHHNNMRSLMHTYIDELFECFMEEEHTQLHERYKGRKGQDILQASLYTGSGIGDSVQSVISVMRFITLSNSNVSTSLYSICVSCDKHLFRLWFTEPMFNML